MIFIKLLSALTMFTVAADDVPCYFCSKDEVLHAQEVEEMCTDVCQQGSQLPAISSQYDCNQILDNLTFDSDLHLCLKSTDKKVKLSKI